MHPSHTRIVPSGLAALALLGLAAGLRAQTAPAAAPKKPEEVLQLSEFNVKADEERGYVASETMTGSRVATKIIDLPYQVNVLTSEFLEDFGVFELADNVTFIGGFSGLDVGGGFTLRGFGATSQLRDGFYRLGRYGASNVDRIEIIKGPNAAIYGRTSPGGMMNMISKSPKSRESEKFTVTHGSFNTDRWVVELTGPLLQSKLGKTNYIFTGSEYQKGFDQPYARNRNKEYLFAVSHDFSDDSHLTFSAEWFLQIRHAPNSSAPLVSAARTATPDNTATSVVLGYDKALAQQNAYGPYSELNRGSDFFTLSYDKRFNDVWTLRAATNFYQARRWDFNQNTGFGSITIPISTTAAVTSTRGATPNKRLIFEDGGGLQADLLAHQFLANHKIESKTLFTLDINDYYRYDPQWNYGASNNPDLVAWNAASSGRVIALDRTTLAPTAPLTYFPKFFQWGQEVQTALFRQRTTVFGGLIRQQTAFLDGRLLTYVGGRYDDARFKGTDYFAKVTVDGKWLSAFKPNGGVNYKLTNNLRTYVNYSESYFIDQTTKPVAISDPTFDFETAKGWDYGFKGSYFDDRLNFTIGGYYATRQNVSVTDTIESPVGSGNYVQVSQRDGDQLCRGWEADATWRVTPEVYAGGSFGNVNSKYTQFGNSTPLATGRSVNGVVPENGSAYIKYSPREGILKGFSANLMCTYSASTPAESPSAGDTYATIGGKRVLTGTTYQWALRTPSFTLWNLGLHYHVRGSSNLDHSFNLNINNLFDLDYLKVNKTLGERRGIYLSYTLTHGAARY